MHESGGKEYRVELLTYCDFLAQLETGDVFHLDENAHAVFQQLSGIDPEAKPLIAVRSNEIEQLPCVSIQAAHAALLKPNWRDGSRHIGCYGTDPITFMSVVDKTDAVVLLYSKSSVRIYAKEHGYTNQIAVDALNWGEFVDIMVSGVHFLTDEIVGMKIKDFIDTDIELSRFPDFIKSSHAPGNGMYWWIVNDRPEDGPAPDQEMGV
jgi:hypothetical protein